MAAEKRTEAKAEVMQMFKQSLPERLLAAIGRIAPRQTVRGIERRVMAAGLNFSGEMFTGIYIIVPIVLLIISAVVLWSLKFSEIVIAGGAAAVALIALGIIYQLVQLRVDERRDKIEQMLPDFLSLTSANIRAGMQLDKALWYAAKPEFEILAHEVELASKRVFSGETLDKALDSLSARFESRYLTRTIDLIKEGEVSGGEMANILEKTAMDLRDLQIMRKEISASMIMYSIFIGFSAAIGAPFLYVVSHRLIMMFEQLWSRKQVESAAASVQGVQMAAPGLTSAEFSMFAIVFIVITTVIATAMISVIQSGSKRNALKYVLPFLAVALLTFYVGGKVLGLLFGAVTL